MGGIAHSSYAYWRGASQKVADALVDANAGAVDVTDNKGKLPVRGLPAAALRPHSLALSLPARLFVL